LPHTVKKARETIKAEVAEFAEGKRMERAQTIDAMRRDTYVEAIEQLSYSPLARKLSDAQQHRIAKIVAETEVNIYMARKEGASAAELTAILDNSNALILQILGKKNAKYFNDCRLGLNGLVTVH